MCIAGFLGYFFVAGDILWTLAAATSIGSIVAAPLAALTVRRLSSRYLKYAIAVLTIALGTYTLVDTFA